MDLRGTRFDVDSGEGLEEGRSLIQVLDLRIRGHYMSFCLVEVRSEGGSLLGFLRFLMVRGFGWEVEWRPIRRLYLGFCGRLGRLAGVGSMLCLALRWFRLGFPLCRCRGRGFLLSCMLVYFCLRSDSDLRIRGQGRCRVTLTEVWIVRLGTISSQMFLLPLFESRVRVEEVISCCGDS